MIEKAGKRQFISTEQRLSMMDNAVRRSFRELERDMGSRLVLKGCRRLSVVRYDPERRRHEYIGIWDSVNGVLIGPVRVSTKEKLKGMSPIVRSMFWRLESEIGEGLTLSSRKGSSQLMVCLRRSQAYVGLFDPQTGEFRPKSKANTEQRLEELPRIASEKLRELEDEHRTALLVKKEHGGKYVVVKPMFRDGRVTGYERLGLLDAGGKFYARRSRMPTEQVVKAMPAAAQRRFL